MLPICLSAAHEMTTAIKYGMPHELKTLFVGSVTIKKQDGRYTVALYSSSADCDLPVAEKLATALEQLTTALKDMENELNAN